MSEPNLTQLIKRQPLEFPYLAFAKTGRMEAGKLKGWCELDLAFCGEEGFAGNVLFVTGRGVSEVSLKMTGALFGLVLSVEDRKADQVEQRRYRVTETERGEISFFCDELRARIGNGAEVESDAHPPE